MKTKISILAVLITSIFLFSCSLANNMTTAKGNGNIVEKVIDIADYNAIDLKGAGNVIYTQSESAAPYLSIQIDENLLEHTNIHIDGATLVVASQKDVNLRFTKFIIKTNSKVLSKVLISGSGNVTTDGKINIENLEMKISGSGNININELETRDLKASIAGSGDINLKGTATNSSYSIAGSGNINTKELVQETVNCNIAGSGNITVNAEKSLDAKVAGSGDIYYKGTPSVNTSVAGSGKVKKIVE